MDQHAVNPIEPGICHCGCGRPTTIAGRNRPEHGWVKGEYLKYCLGHSRKMRGSPVVGPDEKWCGDCRQVKPKAEFHRKDKAACGLQGVCKVCSAKRVAARRAENPERHRLYNEQWRITREYGMTMKAYRALFEKQEGKCAICGKEEPRKHNGVRRALNVDHDHVTGAVRGLLCNSCNPGIGMFNDDPELLRRAITYLTR